MTNKSINAEKQTVTGDSVIDSCPNEAQCTRYFGGCGVTVCFNPNNTPASGINPQGSLKRHGV